MRLKTSCCDRTSPDLHPSLQASLVEQERVLETAHAEIMAAARAHAATAAAAAALGAVFSSEDAGAKDSMQPSAEDRRRVDALRELMLHPDR